MLENIIYTIGGGGTLQQKTNFVGEDYRLDFDFDTFLEWEAFPCCFLTLELFSPPSLAYFELFRLPWVNSS